MFNTLANIFDKYQLKISRPETKTMLIIKINNSDKIHIKKEAILYSKSMNVAI